MYMYIHHPFILTFTKCVSSFLPQIFSSIMLGKGLDIGCVCVCIVNPRRTCAAKVTVVVVCVCVCVCLSVKSHLTSGASVHPENAVTYSAGDEGEKICGVFSETAPLPRSSTPSVVRPCV